ncbi:hypothetical protein [Sodalis sp.]|uniref:hypothetical protein n=1 Tax=Sodalis sp. (in: enterobacteria) TaxID=1898979 RepID=UPI003872B922
MTARYPLGRWLAITVVAELCLHPRVAAVGRRLQLQQSVQMHGLRPPNQLLYRRTHNLGDIIQPARNGDSARFTTVAGINGFF